jgi:hypothetical protein
LQRTDTEDTVSAALLVEGAKEPERASFMFKVRYVHDAIHSMTEAMVADKGKHFKTKQERIAACVVKAPLALRLRVMQDKPLPVLYPLQDTLYGCRPWDLEVEDKDPKKILFETVKYVLGAGEGEQGERKKGGIMGKGMSDDVFSELLDYMAIRWDTI